MQHCCPNNCSFDIPTSLIDEVCSVIRCATVIAFILQDCQHFIAPRCGFAMAWVCVWGCEFELYRPPNIIHHSCVRTDTFVATNRNKIHFVCGLPIVVGFFIYFISRLSPFFSSYSILTQQFECAEWGEGCPILRYQIFIFFVRTMHIFGFAAQGS